MAASGRKFSWFRCIPVICIVIFLFLLMGCTAVNPDGNNNNLSNYSGNPGTVGETPTPPGTFGETPTIPGGDTSNGGSGSGTQTWLAKVSVSYNDNDNYEYSLKSDPTSTMKHRFMIADSYKGSFPVVVTHETTTDGQDKFDSQLSPEGGYSVDGQYEKELHDYMTNQEALAHPMAYSTDDTIEQGTIAKTDFQLEIIGTKGYVSLDDSGTQITGRDKETFSDPEVPPSDDPVSETGGSFLRCNNFGDDDEFTGGSHDFHRDGATYVFQCQATQVKPYTDDEDDHYTGGSADTVDVTLNVVLDPNYVPLGTLNPV